MNLKRGDLVMITHKDNIRARVIGFYAHTMDALVETEAGNQWIVSPLNLAIVKEEKKKWQNTK